MTYTAPHPGEPERDLTETESLEARDLVGSMKRRLEGMEVSLISKRPILRSFEQRLLELAIFTEELQAVIWAAWGEDKS